jgi:hypothetical protein
MDFLANAVFYMLIFMLVAPTIPAWPFLWLIWWAIEGHTKTRRPQARSQPVVPHPPVPARAPTLMEQRKPLRDYEMAQWEAKQRLKAEGKNWLP